MAGEWLEEIRSRRFFYRDYYRKTLKALLWMLLLIILLLFAIVYVYLTQPPRQFYATSNDGGIHQLTPLDAPNMSDKPLIN